MSASTTVLFYEKCRLCLAKPGKYNVTETQDLREEILLTTGVNVTALDNLPQKICSECKKIVKKATALRLLASQNNEHLRLLFNIDPSDDEPRLIIDEGESTVESSPNVKQNLELEPKIEILTQTTKNAKKKRKITSSAESEDKKKIKRIVVRSLEDYKNVKKCVLQIDEPDIISFECEICDKTFEAWKKLYHHKRQHNKNLACPLDGCEKKFATKADLEKHLRTHTGVRPYVCEICDKAFTQQGTLKTHKETVHYCFTYS